jgi:hypothetical protein
MSTRYAGRNRISSKAIRAVTSAIAAAELNTTAKAVAVELGDDNGALLVAVSAPVGIPSLAAAASPRGGSVPTILARASNAQATIRTRVLELTGSTVGRVNVRLVTADIEGHGSSGAKHIHPARLWPSASPLS